MASVSLGPQLFSPPAAVGNTPATAQPVRARHHHSARAPVDQSPPGAELQQAMRTSFFSQLGDFLRHCEWQSVAGDKVASLPRSLTPGQITDFNTRLLALASDPAKGKVSPGSIEEAAVGVAAEMVGIAAAVLLREATGQAEFIDGAGEAWDVKSPVSPAADARWRFDAPHQLEKVKHDLSQHNHVLLNLSRCNDADANAVLANLRAGLSSEEQTQVLVLRRSSNPR